MGICQNQQRQANVYSTKALLNNEYYNGADFYFSTESLLRLDADTLILFTDSGMKLKKNSYLQRGQGYQGKKLQQYALQYLATTNRDIIIEEIIRFPIQIMTLRFKQVIVVLLKQWDVNKQVGKLINQQMNRLFLLLRQQRITSIAITEFNSEFGIPSYVNHKQLLQQLILAKDFLKTITVVCQNENSQTEMMELVSKGGVTGNKNVADNFSVVEKESVESNYF